MGLGEDERRLVEFGALLHDVGKIAVPKEIINKAGPLDDAEWAIMKQHTIYGQQMLDKVGGSMTDVGVVVRASHERWDGNGYPDGTAGEDVPLAARDRRRRRRVQRDHDDAVLPARAVARGRAAWSCRPARGRSSTRRSSTRSLACSPTRHPRRRQSSLRSRPSASRRAERRGAAPHEQLLAPQVEQPG